MTFRPSILRPLLLVLAFGVAGRLFAAALLPPKAASAVHGAAMANVTPMIGTVDPVLNAPTGLKARRAAGGVLVSWNASADAGVAGYQVFSGQASGNYSLSQNVLLVTNLLFTNLVTGSTNFFALKEHDAAWNESALSAEALLWLGPPKRVNVVVISWNAVDGQNVATVVQTTTDMITAPIQTWGACFAGKGTNFNYTNDWACHRFFRAATVFTNL